VALTHTGVVSTSLVVTDFSGRVVGPGSYSLVQSSNPGAGLDTWTIARVASPGSAPTVAAGTGSLTGTYAYAVSFVNAGGETGIGPVSSTIVLSAQGTNLSAIPTGPAGTTARNIYRIKSAGANADNQYHLVAAIADNSTTTLSGETTSDATAVTAALPPAGIASGDTVVLTYNYADQTYFQATDFDNYTAFAGKFGSPYDSSGNIASPLSFAARLAFLNGASEVVGVAAASGSQVDLQTALSSLANDPTIRIVVIADGSAGSLSSLQAHVDAMNVAGYYRIGVAGLDGSSSSIPATTIRSAALATNDQAVRLVGCSSFQMENPISGKTMNVGAQYAAAAISGMYAARDVQIPLTRKTIAGFIGLNDLHTANDQVLDSQAGLLAINLLGGILQIRHDVTTAPGIVTTRESSVVRSKYEMAAQLKSALDAGVIGLVATPDRAVLVVTSVVTGVLEALVLDQVIAAYANVAAQVSQTDPTTIQAQFVYTPSYPINNIVVNFTVNTTTGDFNLA
jgi:hypothetical protein